MKTKGKVIVMGLLLVAMVGCGKYLLPSWVVEIGNHRWGSFAFASQDNSALILVNKPYDQAVVTVETFDQQGGLINTYSFPFSHYSFNYITGMVRATGNAFYVVDSALQTIVYSDPDTQESWVGVQGDFTDNQTPIIRDALTNDDGDLVLLMQVRTEVEDADLLWPWAIGVVSNDGHLRSFRFLEDFDYISDFHKNDQGGFDAVARLPRPSDGSTPSVSVFLEFDMQGELVQSTERNAAFSAIGYVQSRWLGVQDGETGVFDSTGARLLNADFGGESGLMFLDAPDGFYTFGYINSEYEVQDDSLYITWRTPKVCFYGPTFARQWCKTLTDFRSSDYDDDLVQVGEDGRLLLSRKSESVKLSGGELEIKAFMDKVEGNFNIKGEDSRRLKHLLIDTKGRAVLQAQADPYYHRGTAYFCYIFSICISKDEVHPGFGGNHKTVLLPGRGIYSFVNHWNGEAGNEGHKGQLLYWGPQ